MVIHTTFVYDYCPLKLELYYIWIIVGRDRLPCKKDIGLAAANLLETKILLNSTISDVNKGIRFILASIKD